MSDELELELAQLLGEPVQQLTPVTGGDINDAFRARLASGRSIFVKTHANAPAGAYESEAAGLRWLAEAKALRVPEVLSVSDRALVLELIVGGSRGPQFDEVAGRGLGLLHRHGAPTFGFPIPGFLANLPQDNSARADWPTFYAECRLLPFAALAAQRGNLGSHQLRLVDALCAKLPALCGDAEPPSRLHGDLWSGNVMADANGNPVIFDPAVYGGDREVDLAMLQLFGSPSTRFFAAYDEVYPRKPGVNQRVALYQVLPLLVHVCLFGKSYIGALERALTTYL
jgi:fructosamine-3-kinase